MRKLIIRTVFSLSVQSCTLAEVNEASIDCAADIVDRNKYGETYSAPDVLAKSYRFNFI